MVKTSNAFLTVLLAFVLSAGVAVAQQDHMAMPDQSQGKPNSEEMMKACHRHGAESMAALDQLEKTIAAGRESNDPAKMKAALETAQKQLAEAKHHMSMCPMMGGGQMQDGGMDHMDHMKGMTNDTEKH
jgi:sugar diacid utilization regulator